MALNHALIALYNVYTKLTLVGDSVGDPVGVNVVGSLQLLPLLEDRLWVEAIVVVLDFVALLDVEQAFPLLLVDIVEVGMNSAMRSWHSADMS